MVDTILITAAGLGLAITARAILDAPTARVDSDGLAAAVQIR